MVPTKTLQKSKSATPAREKDRKGKVSRLDRSKEFVRDIRSELRKVVWPTRKETVNLTMIVIGVSTAVGIFLGLVDFAFTEVFQLLLR
jgi:preprotein translocase subunit SecE